MNGEDNDSNARLPTSLWVEAQVRRWSSEGRGVYVTRRGDPSGGLVLLKISDMNGQCRVLAQERDFDGILRWVDALGHAVAAEADGDAYITRTANRDPDIWVIEVEDRNMEDPFQDLR